MFQEGIYDHNIISIDKKSRENLQDHLVIEEPLEIVLKYKTASSSIIKTVSITMRTPGADKDLALGFLFSESLIDKAEDVLDINFRINCQNDEATQQTIILELQPSLHTRINNLERHFYTNSSCGVCGKTTIDLTAQSAKYILKKHDSILDPEEIYKLPQKLKAVQKLFESTGGIHACGLFNFQYSLMHHCEDIGRHNAMDKLIGYSLENKLIPTLDHILILSGRASFELIHKAICIGIPVVASVGAPSSLAVQLADSFGMTLIGFLRDQRMNVYTHPNRLK
ncbi:MAG: formate dehydrogenase accessory sulfurtransferase FdhD [Saprospiraceae bacterium]|nr:formate dehydrogenase accessory sulfurtransferase FdhD [Saprospiraceae bacterium]